MTDAGAIRDTQRKAWAGLSTSWDKWDAVIMAQLRPVGTAIIEDLGITDGQQHLDIACGTGEPGLSIAKLAPNGRVVLTDLVPEMLDIAERDVRVELVTESPDTYWSMISEHVSLAVAAPAGRRAGARTNPGTRAREGARVRTRRRGPGPRAGTVRRRYRGCLT